MARSRGPAGVSIERDAETTRLVGHAGIIRFEPTGDSATRLDIHMSYNPPAGAIGHGVASFLQVDPKAAMDRDLIRLKSLLEDGKTRAHGEPVTMDELEDATLSGRGR